MYTREVEFLELLAVRVRPLVRLNMMCLRRPTVDPENRGRAAFSLNFFSICVLASCDVRALTFCDPEIRMTQGKQTMC